MRVGSVVFSMPVKVRAIPRAPCTGLFVILSRPLRTLVSVHAGQCVAGKLLPLNEIQNVLDFCVDAHIAYHRMPSSTPKQRMAMVVKLRRGIADQEERKREERLS